MTNNPLPSIGRDVFSSKPEPCNERLIWKEMDKKLQDCLSLVFTPSNHARNSIFNPHFDFPGFSIHRSLSHTDCWRNLTSEATRSVPAYPMGIYIGLVLSFTRSREIGIILPTPASQPANQPGEGNYCYKSFSNPSCGFPMFAPLPQSGTFCGCIRSKQIMLLPLKTRTGILSSRPGGGEEIRRRNY